MPFVIDIADLNSQSIEAVLDDTLFYLIINWNESGQYWTLGIRNYAYVTLINGIALSPNYPLTYQFRYQDMPSGDLMAQCLSGQRSGPIPRDGFSTGRYQMIYYTQRDLLLMGVLPLIGYTTSAL
jgi:hypothetical protein